MSKKARVLQSGMCEVTQGYKGTKHNGIDIVKKGYMLDNIVAHSDGTVIQVISNCNGNTPNDSNNPGNMVKIEHKNGYMTRYLHLAYKTVKVKVGDKVKKGQVLGYMGDTGYSFGGHLHFEVWKNGNRIDPTEYLEKDFPNDEQVNEQNVNVFYKVKTQKHGWLPEVKNLEGYAGFEGSPIIGLAIKVNKGSIKYRVHVKGGNWLGWITKYDLNDFDYGYAGDNRPIDAIQVYYYTPNGVRPYKKAKYKVNNYDWQYDTETANGQDGYAGLFGVNATKFQIIIK
jgi:hypothetical protein